MIEDEELRGLFQSECEEHMQTLDEGLLHLETNPRDKAVLEEVFRAAHSLKGSARMLGVGSVETVSHRLEDELSAAKKGRATLTPADIDRLSLGLSSIRKLVQEAVTGESSGVNVDAVLKHLSGKSTPATQSTAPLPQESSPMSLAAPFSSVGNTSTGTPPLSEPTIVQRPLPPEQPFPLDNKTIQVAPTAEQLPKLLTPAEIAPFEEISFPVVSHEQEPQKVATPETEAQSEIARMSALVATAQPLAVVEEPMSAVETPAADFKIQTMRVSPARLDALMTLASELTVTTTRVSRGLSVFDEITILCEEWERDLTRRARLATRLAPHSSDPAIHSLQQLHRDEAERLEALNRLWRHLREAVYENAVRLNFVADELEEGIRNVRLLPLSNVFSLFPRMVRDLARQQSKEIDFVVEGGDTAADKRVLEELKDPLMHMIRNAVDHGIETPDERVAKHKHPMASLRLRAAQSGGFISIELKDDGRGLDVEAIRATALKRQLHTEEELLAMSGEQIQRLIFAPGFSTRTLITDMSGRGVGLDVVRTNVEQLKGTIEVHSVPGAGCTFRIRLPITLATTRVLLVECSGRPYGLPVEHIEGIVGLRAEQLFSLEGRQSFVRDDEAITVVPLAHVLELPLSRAEVTSKQTCVILSIGAQKVGLLVDALVDEQEVVLKPLGPLLKRVRNVAGSTILGAGEVCMILNPHDLLSTVAKKGVPALPAPETSADELRRKVILLAEDSITTRTQEKRILESAGYEVVTAVDGADAFAKLGTRNFDAVVSDVEMPNMDGLSLAAKIREDKRYQELPIVLVTSLASDEDRKRGVEVGASAYITKGTFEQKVLLDTLERLV